MRGWRICNRRRARAARAKIARARIMAAYDLARPAIPMRLAIGPIRLSGNKARRRKAAIRRFSADLRPLSERKSHG